MPVGRFKTYQKKGSFGSLFFGLIFFDAAAVASTQNAKVRKATTPLPLRCPFFLQARTQLPGLGDFGTQSCRSSQSDHSVTSATRFGFFDSQMQGTPSNFQKPGILPPPWTE